MQKLRLVVKSIEPNGAVVMVPLETVKEEKVNKQTGKKFTDASLKKAKRSDIEIRRTKIHPPARLQFVPLPGDEINYQKGDVFQVELKKASK